MHVRAGGFFCDPNVLQNDVFLSLNNHLRIYNLDYTRVDLKLNRVKLTSNQTSSYKILKVLIYSKLAKQKILINIVKMQVHIEHVDVLKKFLTLQIKAI